MRKIIVFAFLCFSYLNYSQKSDFSHIDFSKADSIAKSVKAKRLFDLNKLTYSLTKDLNTDVEKFRSIYKWICTNVANNFSLYSLNKRKRKKFLNDSIKLENWNSDFKKKLFKKLLRKKRTICTGYAYLLKEMCTLVGIESRMVNGFGKTATTDFSELPMPNHTWNVVKINNKWYLCDPTWSTGISFPEEGRFAFTYNDGYFLANPKIFNLHHFPLESKYSLLGENAHAFVEFDHFPVIYGDAYHYLDELISPKKMYHEIKKENTFTFQYKLLKKINPKDIKFVVFNGANEQSYQPKVTLKEKLLTLQQTFTRKGFYDLHLYIENKLIATYVFKISKS